MMHSMDVAKTQEIMARFCPIAPRPTLPHDGAMEEEKPHAAAAAISGPRRVRKRFRESFPLMVPCKRPTLPLLPAPQNTTFPLFHCTKFDVERGVLVERDLLQKLEKPKVFIPKPVRLVTSTILVGCITKHPSISFYPLIFEKPKEVEEELESETLPAVVSDSSNLVRLTNSAYKEMVGQPVCPWLKTILSGPCGGIHAPLPSRINGKVTLDLPTSKLPTCGFACRVMIQWVSCNRRQNTIEAGCTVIPFYFKSKDCLFIWKFQPSRASTVNFKL